MNRLCLGLSVFIALMLVSLSWTHFGISQNLGIVQKCLHGDKLTEAISIWKYP